MFHRIMTTTRPEAAGAFGRLGAFALAVLVLAGAWDRPRAAEPKIAALLPLRLNAGPELLYLRDGLAEMLNSRLFVPGGLAPLSRPAVARLIPAAPLEMSESSARDLGRRLGADFIVFGSATLPGQGISLDLKMADVSGRRGMKSFFDQSGDADGIMACVERVAEDMRNWALDRPRTAGPAAAETRTPVKSAPDAGAEKRHPEQIFKQEVAKNKIGQAAGVSEQPVAAAQNPEPAAGSRKPPAVSDGPAVLEPAAVPAAPVSPPSVDALPAPAASTNIAPVGEVQPGADRPQEAARGETGSSAPPATLPPPAAPPAAVSKETVGGEPPAGSGGAAAWTVLILSERTEDEARRAAGALQQQGFAVRVERAEIPLKGVWYRVLAGEFASKAEAQGMLDRLRRAGFKPTAMPIRTGR